MAYINHKDIMNVGDHDIEFLHPFSDVCCRCQYFAGNGLNRVCQAFPNEIPDTIWLEENKHTAPYPGDHGLQFIAATK